jgi:hypothetical protein
MQRLSICSKLGARLIPGIDEDEPAIVVWRFLRTRCQSRESMTSSSTQGGASARLFASGKFDQYRHDIPYVILVEVFRSVALPLLGKSDTELEL